MAPTTIACPVDSTTGSLYQIDSAQTLRASTALLRKIQHDQVAQKDTAKPSLLADEDATDDAEDEAAIWLILTTKKHIVDKKRLKPGKITLPHPYLTADKENLRICLITADPQRKYKDLVDAENGFPAQLAGQIKRVIGMEKLKAKYKSFESRRQLAGEYDIFLADQRIITYLPKTLGKIFYKGGSKRPVPVHLEGKRQSVDEQGNKRKKLVEGGDKVMKADVKVGDVAGELKKALNSALVHLSPSTTTAIKVGTAAQTAEQVQENIEAVVAAMVEKFVPQQWKNVRAVHIKGPNTAALPIWMTEELWEDEKDVLVEPPKANVGKKRKRDALAEVIEVPGPDGKMRQLEKPSSKRKSLEAQPGASPVPSKKRKGVDEDEDVKAMEKAEKAARKKAIAEQKEAARGDNTVKSEDLADPSISKATKKKVKTKSKVRVEA